MADQAVDVAIYKMAFDDGGSVQKMGAVQSAGEGVVTSMEKIDNQTRTTSAGFERLQARFDPLVKAEQERSKALAQVTRFQNEGIGSDRERASLIDQINQRYNTQVSTVNKVTGATKEVAGSVGLANHELVNLSRQMQDVAVSLGSGQSPFTVLLQQGTQIADVFGTSQGTVRGFFSQIGQWAESVLTPFRVATGAAVGLGAGIILAVSSFQSAQAEIGRSLSGMAGASRASAADINSVAESASSFFGLSVGEARDAAVAFAATGRIYRDTLGPLVGITHDFAIATGQSTSDAIKSLGSAFAEPTKGAIALNKELGFLDARTLELIKSLEASGNVTKAQTVLLDAMSESAKRAAESQGILAKAWGGLKNIVAGGAETFAMAASQLFNIDPNTNQKIAKTREELIRLQESVAKGIFNQTTLDQMVEAANRLRELEQIADAETWAQYEKQLNQISQAARNVANEFLPEIAAVTQAADAFKHLFDISQRQDSAAVIDKMGLSADEFSKALQRASTNLEFVTRTAREAADESQRHKEAVLQIAAAYGNVSSSVAVTLSQMQDQLRIAEAVTGIERMRAQAAATTNAALLEGKTAEEASAIAGQQHAIAEAQVNTNARATLLSLQDQYAVSIAQTGAQRMVAQAQATYNSLVRDGVSSIIAEDVAAQQLANSQAQANAAVADQTRSLNQQTDLIEARMRGDEQSVAAAQAYANAIRQGADNMTAMAAAAAVVRNQMALALQNAQAAWDQYNNSYPRAPGGTSATGLFKYPVQAPIWAQNQYNNIYGSGGYQAFGTTFNSFLSGSRTTPFAGVTPNQQGYNFQLQNDIATKLANGANPLDLIKTVSSYTQADALTKFKEILDLEKRGGISPQQTLAEIQSHKIGQGVSGIELLQAIDELKQATQQNTDATNANTVGLSGIYSAGHAAIGYYNYGSGGSADGTYAGAPIPGTTTGGTTTSVPGIHTTVGVQGKDVFIPYGSIGSGTPTVNTLSSVDYSKLIQNSNYISASPDFMKAHPYGYADGGTIPAHGLGYVGEHGPMPRLIRAGSEPIHVTPEDPDGRRDGRRRYANVTNIFNFQGDASADRRRSVRQFAEGAGRGLAALN